MTNLSTEALKRFEESDPIEYARLSLTVDYFDIVYEAFERSFDKYQQAENSERKKLAEETLKLGEEVREVDTEIKLILKEAQLKYGDFKIIDQATKSPESPVAELSRLLIENFEVCNAFGTVNSEEIANIVGRKLSTHKINKAVLANFDGVKFRKQNGGYTYTLRRRDTVNFND